MIVVSIVLVMVRLEDLKFLLIIMSSRMIYHQELLYQSKKVIDNKDLPCHF